MSGAIPNAMAFFDVQNLFQHAKEAFGHHHPNFDPVKLHGAVCHRKGWRPTLVRVYTGTPSRVENPMWHDYWNNRVLALKRAGVHVTTRPLRYRRIVDPVTGNVTSFAQEKGIDVRLALDLIGCVRHRQFDVAIIYSQDQDLSEAALEAKEIAREQARTIVMASAYPGGPRASARRGIDRTDWIGIEQDVYDACLDPRDYRPRTA